jgi:O-antigen ligase
VKLENQQIMIALLCAVVMSSLVLLVFGLNAQPGIIEIMQLPTTVAQILFVLAVARYNGLHAFLDCLTVIQRSLIGLLIGYVLIASFASPVPSSPLFAPSWIVHILFFVALISFCRDQDASAYDTIWIAVGIAAFIHVCAFMFAWVLWPEQIRQANLPAFDNIRHLGYFLAPAGAVMAIYFVTRPDRFVLPLLCFSAATFYIFYTGSRGGAVALVAGLIVIGAYLAWHRHRVSPARVVILLGVASILIVISELIPSLPWRPVFGRGAAAMTQTGAQMLNGRAEVWAFTGLAIQQNWLWGYGPAIMGQIPEYQGPIFRHPHNIGLQLLLHWGVLGTLIVIATVLAFAANIWIAMRRQPSRALLALTVLATMCIHSLVDGGLYYTYSTVVAIVAFASLESIGWRDRNARKTP